MAPTTTSAGDFSSTGSLGSYSDTVLPKFVVSTTIPFFLALVTYSLRMYTRMHPNFRLGLDDYVMTVAVLLTATTYACSLGTFVVTGGRHLQYITFTALEKGLVLAWITRLSWNWALAMIRISVALMIFRIKNNNKKWRLGILCLVMVLLFFAIGETFALLLECRPVKAYWHIAMRLKSGTCLSTDFAVVLNWVSAAFFGAADIICALLPLAFIRTLKQPMREKVVLAILMGMGVFACICSIMRAVLFKSFLLSPDPAFTGVDVAIWSYSEAYVGIIAANLPCLRTYLQKLVRVVGGHITTKESGHYGTTAIESSNRHTTLLESSRSKPLDDVELNKFSDGQAIVVTHDLEAHSIEEMPQRQVA